MAGLLKEQNKENGAKFTLKATSELQICPLSHVGGKQVWLWGDECYENEIDEEIWSWIVLNLFISREVTFIF